VLVSPLHYQIIAKASAEKLVIITKRASQGNWNQLLANNMILVTSWKYIKTWETEKKH